jgi:hypothetical protein
MPEVGDGRPAGRKPAALLHPQFNSGLWLAFTASGKALSPLPVKECPRLSERRVPGSSPGGSTGVSRYGSAALPSPQPTHVSRPGVRRQRTATLSSPSPRSPDWAHIRVNVDHSGRGLPPTAHAHAPRSPNGAPKAHDPESVDRTRWLLYPWRGIRYHENGIRYHFAQR